MKGAGKIIILMSAVAALFLVYVHEQFLVFHVSYELGRKTTLYSKKSEDYRRLKFQVDQMKAPRLLEDQMNKLKLDLTLPKEVHVFKVAPKMLPKVEVGTVQMQPLSGRLTSLLGQWIDIAQAKTDN